MPDLPPPAGTNRPQPGSDRPRPSTDRPPTGRDRPQPGSDRRHPGEVAELVASLHAQLARLEHLLGPEARVVRDVEHLAGRTPGFARAAGEPRWPVTLVVAVAIALQVLLPERLTIGPAWLLPALQAVLAVGLTAANPKRVDRRSALLRTFSIGLMAVISLANGWSDYRLIRGILDHTMGGQALLAAGAIVYLTNIIVFALWYWEWDQGGPVARLEGDRSYPDFQFPQMAAQHLAPPNWRPTFVDYLYLSYTNVTAFSPTDTMPLARWAKVLMLFQSAVALVTVALVIGRAVNILA